MSSNPFRRSVASKLPHVELASSPSSAATHVPGDAPTTPAQPPTKKKRVKIQTPPHSPDDAFTLDNHAGPRLSPSHYAARVEPPPSPPPAVRLNGEEESDSTATADSDREEALKNMRTTSASLPPARGAASASAVRAPYNPFAPTLASEQKRAPKQESGDEMGREQRAGTGRPPMDVDQFKNILLTGSALPSLPTAGATTTGATTAGAAISQPRPPDSSSTSTDTSSIFDPAYAMPSESPRTSFDDYEDASESEANDENEHSNLMGEGRLDDLAPPAPPKPQKPARGPQTVSFADFDQTIPPDFQSTQRARSPVNPQLAGILRPPMLRSSSDLNKPLPPPPPKSPADPAPEVPHKDISPPQQSLTVPQPATEDPAGSKKAPPPPPVRRTAGDTGRPRSASNLSNATLDSVNSAGRTGSGVQAQMPQKTEDGSTKLAPPPPPARKTNSSAQSSTPAIGTPSKESPPSNSTNEVSKAAPLPPPRRHPSKSVREIPGRSSSDLGRQNLKPGDAFLSALTSAHANSPPAPPPRRVGGSKRTSMDGPPDTLARRLSTEHHRRSSNNSLDSDRSASTSSLQQVAETELSSEQAVVSSPPVEPRRDILADMTAFQAEIDALRAKEFKGR
ncbi:Hypothetical predicted protein [Lecanosticta acicola]|uniref:Uncharacterized protein n=1 Tax=Lecanosticta acicola TaxID=111012 RepID=A0AAI9EDM6_9PEZI|nr:Hypothetical predicted protein [Lecanosticta acicola]